MKVGFSGNYSLLKLLLFALLGIVTGLTSFSFIVMVNSIIELQVKNIMPREHNFMLIFLLIILLFFITRRLLSQGIIEFSQNVFWSIRKDIVLAIIKAPYLKVRELREEIYSALTSDVNNITNASLVIINFVSSIILVITCFIYLGYLSMPLFVLSTICIAIGIFIFLQYSKIGNMNFIKVRNMEKGFMKGFNAIIEGNKEIKINSKKGDDLFKSSIKPVIYEGEKLNVGAYIGYLNSQLVSQLLFYCIIAIILVMIGNYFVIELSTTISFVFALLYLLGPIVNIMLNIPILNQALVSYNKLTNLRENLSVNNEPSSKASNKLSMDSSFESITFDGYEYSYPDNSFSIGPLNLCIKANEIVFIYGGNGSGKTTFINTILTLFIPQKGELFINNIKIYEGDLIQTRTLFSPVFSDFYLFEDFYGVVNVDNERVQRLLKLFEIDHKVTFQDNKLSTTDLSTGQRKRLALIAAILEDRPILVLDEWAADQDPYFRKKFYKEIIHKIVNEENKTIIAITHDDNYYNEADRLLKMNYGKLEEIKGSISTTINDFTS